MSGETYDALIVEDSRTQADHLRHALQNGTSAFRVRVASNGQEALDMVRLTRPDIVISDIMMPVMDGYEMCRRLKLEPALKDVPVILLTSLADAQDIVKGLNSGADYYLTKPFEPAFLISKVLDIIAHPEGLVAERESGWEIKAGGECHQVTAEPRQLLNLLVATYENAVQQNHKLVEAQDQLRRSNEHLEETVGIRTRELSQRNDQLRDEIERRKNIEQQLQCQLRRLNALRHIDMAITSSLDLRVTLNVILDQVTTHLAVDAADILLSNPATQRLEIGAQRGFFIHRPTDDGSGFVPQLASQSIHERRPIHVPDLAATSSIPVDSADEFHFYYAAPLIAKGSAAGVLEVFHRMPFTPDRDWREFFDALAGQAAIAIDNAQMFDEIRRSKDELALAYDTTLEGWSKALELRDKETEGHSMRVTRMTERLARALGISGNELVHMRRGALLHDIGKMGIPDRILRKRGPLDNAEWEIMRKHPTYAFEMLSPIGFLRPALDIPYCHHEKWNGNGYPRGLKGGQIPLAARIFSLVDVWDALRSDLGSMARNGRSRTPSNTLAANRASISIPRSWKGSCASPSSLPRRLRYMTHPSDLTTRLA